MKYFDIAILQRIIVRLVSVITAYLLVTKAGQLLHKTTAVYTLLVNHSANVDRRCNDITEFVLKGGTVK